MEEKKPKTEKMKIAKEAMKVLGELEDSVKVEHVIKDNKIEFKIGEKFFRIRKPTFEEQQTVNKKRRKKYLELIDDDTYLFRKQWITKLKNKGINIDKMDDDIKRLQNEIENILMRLATTKSVKTIGEIKKEVLKLREEQYAVNVEKTDLLANSIEDQILIYVNSYITYLVIERKHDEKWERHFKTFRDFEESEDGELTHKSIYYLNLLIYGA